MAYHENIEKLFNDEVREKRKTGSGVFSRRGKGVKHGISGAFRTPYYFMSAKEKKKLNGEVEVTFMYETILTREDFLLKDIETQKRMLTRWREIYSNEDIMAQMGITGSGSFHKLINDLDIPKKSRWSRASKTVVKKPKEKAPKVEQQTLLDDDLTKKTISEPKNEVEEQKVRPILITKGMHLEYNGEYTAEQLSKIFTKLQLLTDGEENKFNLAISLTERA